VKVLEVIVPRREFSKIKEILEEKYSLSRLNASIEVSSDIGLDTIRAKYLLPNENIKEKVLKDLNAALRGKLGYYLIYNEEKFTQAYLSKKYINFVPSICIYCGAPMEENSLVCPKCGKKYPFICPKCGSKMTLAKVCVKCGFKL